MAAPTTWDSGNWDSGTWDAPVAPIKSKNMNAKVALNLKNLKPREKLAKFQTGITKCGAAPALANANPTLVVCQASHDATKTILDTIDTKETELTNLRIQRDQTLDTAMGNYSALGSCVESASLGDPAFITAKGFDVASDPTSLPDVGRVTNLGLTHGDHDGTVDGAWNRDRSARSYEVQTSPDPMSATGWVTNQISTRSSCTIAGQTLGTKLWVRVRALGAGVPGDWSDAAAIIVA